MNVYKLMERPVASGIGVALVGMLASATGCGDGGSGEGEPDSGSDVGQPDGGANGGDTDLYAVPTEIYNADFSSSTSFIALVESLDVDQISLDGAREVDGRGSVATVEEWLFIAGSNEPVIDRFEVEADGSLTAAGSLSFANYGLTYFSLDAWGNIMISPTKAYMFNGSDASHIVWNPTTMEIVGEIPGPDIVQEGYQIESSPPVVRGNKLYRTFTLLNYDTWEFLAEPQYLAVYDVENDERINLVEETRCPQLYSRPFIDENNDIYFSGWVWTVGETLVNSYPKNCALRLLEGEDTFDPDWSLSYADDITDGREAGVLRYLGDGRALLDVFHDERATIGDETTSQELSNTPNWRLWSIDLDEKTGAPVQGLDFKAAGYQDAVVDGRTFLMAPNDSYSETTAYEIVDGEAAEAFKIEGSSYHMVKVR